MGFCQHGAPNRVLIPTLILLFLGQCHNSKISFPEDQPPVLISLESDSSDSGSSNSSSSSNSSTNFNSSINYSSITSATVDNGEAKSAPTEDNVASKSSFVRFSDNSDFNFLTDSPVYSLFPGENAILSGDEIRENNLDTGEGAEEGNLIKSSVVSNDGLDAEPEGKGYVRSLEIQDSREQRNPDRRLRYEDERRGWQYDDDEEDRRSRPPDKEKTIGIQLLDEDPYHHGRPAWPHDEYLLGYFDLKNAFDRIRGVNSSSSPSSDDDRNGDPFENTLSPEELSKYYDWKRLQPRPSPSAFIGPGFYDVGSSDPSQSAEYYRYQQPTYQAITTNAKVQTTGSSSTTSSGIEESVPGTPSESHTNTRGLPAFIPYDLYKRKRLRLQIHPGLIAAPLAGLAAFGAASALTSKPLLVELGYVKNKPDIIAGGGWGWVGTGGTGYRPYPPFYPPPNPPPVVPPFGVGTGHVGHLPPHHHHHVPGGGLGVGFGGGIAHGSALSGAGGHGGGGGGGPIYPILKPIRHKPESERTSWWNPFSALTPRLVIE